MVIGQLEHVGPIFVEHAKNGAVQVKIEHHFPETACEASCSLSGEMCFIEGVL